MSSNRLFCGRLDPTLVCKCDYHTSGPVSGGGIVPYAEVRCRISEIEGTNAKRGQSPTIRVHCCFHALLILLKKVSANRQTRPRIVRKGKNGPRRIGPRQIPQNVGSHLSQGTRKKSPFRTKRRHPKVNSSVAEWTFNSITDTPPA